MDGRSMLSRQVFRPGVPARYEFHRVRDDALIRYKPSDTFRPSGNMIAAPPIVSDPSAALKPSIVTMPAFFSVSSVKPRLTSALGFVPFTEYERVVPSGALTSTVIRTFGLTN